MKSRLPIAVIAALLGLGLVGVTGQSATAASANVVISQVYSGGGLTGSPYQYDFIELYNRGPVSQSLNGWSLQYAGATGTGLFGASSTSLTPLPSVALGPGQYLMVREGAGFGCGGFPCGAELPSPDVTDGTPIALMTGAGKVALVSQASALGCNGSSTPCDASQLASIVDLVGYGTGTAGATFFEGAAPAPTLSATTAALRGDDGSVDTDDNAADFAAGAPNPRGSGGMLLSIDDVTHNESIGSQLYDFTVSISAPAPAGGVTFDIATGDGTATTADNDYIAESLTGVSIPEGEASYVFSVIVNGDTKPELDETFVVDVTNVIGATVGDGHGVGTLLNDDGAPSPETVAIITTGASCAMLDGGTATTLPEITYAVKKGKVTALSVGTFSYWIAVGAVEGTNSVTVDQTITSGNFAKLFAAASGSNVYRADCRGVKSRVTQATTDSVSGSVTVTFTAPAEGTYFLNVKLATNEVKGEAAPAPGTVRYVFSTAGISGSTRTLELTTP